MKCLIVAAGQGSRLREKGELKPLVLLHGVPLIEQVIARGQKAGLSEFLIVSGYRGAELRQELDRFAARERVSIKHILNEEWTRANGVSLLKGKPYLNEPFVLMMCDHLVDPGIVRGLISAKIEPDSVALAVDFNIDSSLNDPLDVTRVQCQEGRIVHIGKLLPEFNAFDTGVFYCKPIIFAALEESQANGDDSISGAMNVLARWQKAYFFDIEGKVWLDIDDPVDFKKAEGLLDAGKL